MGDLVSRSGLHQLFAAWMWLLCRPSWAIPSALLGPCHGPPGPSPGALCEQTSNGTFAVSPQVSQAAADLLAYCEAHVREDPLIIPVPASENPFREKKFFCTIL